MNSRSSKWIPRSPVPIPHRSSLSCWASLRQETQSCWSPALSLSDCAWWTHAEAAPLVANLPSRIGLSAYSCSQISRCTGTLILLRWADRVSRSRPWKWSLWEMRKTRHTAPIQWVSDPSPQSAESASRFLSCSARENYRSGASSQSRSRRRQVHAWIKETSHRGQKWSNRSCRLKSAANFWLAACSLANQSAHWWTDLQASGSLSDSRCTASLQVHEKQASSESRVAVQQSRQKTSTWCKYKLRSAYLWCNRGPNLATNRWYHAEKSNFWHHCLALRWKT